MADDPRLEPVAAWLGALQGGGGTYPYLAAICLSHADSKDPLRALLADEDRAVELIAEAISGCSPEEWEDVKRREPDWRDTPGAGAARAVLAALREVAGP